MAWLWDSWEEYKEYVMPQSVKQGLFRLTYIESWHKSEQRLFEAVTAVQTALESLYRIGFTGKDSHVPPAADSITTEVKHLVVELIHNGEELLLLNKKLAVSDAAYGFLHQHEILEH